jgi:hypothetical protein
VTAAVEEGETNTECCIYTLQSKEQTSRPHLCHRASHGLSPHTGWLEGMCKGRGTEAPAHQTLHMYLLPKVEQAQTHRCV